MFKVYYVLPIFRQKPQPMGLCSKFSIFNSQKFKYQFTIKITILSLLHVILNCPQQVALWNSGQFILWGIVASTEREAKERHIQGSQLSSSVFYQELQRVDGGRYFVNQQEGECRQTMQQAYLCWFWPCHIGTRLISSGKTTQIPPSSHHIPNFRKMTFDVRRAPEKLFVNLDIKTVIVY